MTPNTHVSKMDLGEHASSHFYLGILFILLFLQPLHAQRLSPVAKQKSISHGIFLLIINLGMKRHLETKFELNLYRATKVRFYVAGL